MSDSSSKPDRHSLWDTVACLGVKPTLGRLVAATPRGIRLERARNRVLRFAKAAAAQRGTAPSILKENLGRLGEEYRRRAARWEAHLEPHDPPRAKTADGGGSGCLGIHWMPLEFLGVLETAWVVPIVIGLVAVGAVAVIPVLLIPPAVFAFRRRRVRARLRRALQARACPDCGYDLRGLDPALPPDLLDGTDVGPAWCPECGSPWPMVPPPARGERP